MPSLKKVNKSSLIASSELFPWSLAGQCLTLRGPCGWWASYRQLPRQPTQQAQHQWDSGQLGGGLNPRDCLPTWHSQWSRPCRPIATARKILLEDHLQVLKVCGMSCGSYPYEDFTLQVSAEGEVTALISAGLKIRWPAFKNFTDLPQSL